MYVERRYLRESRLKNLGFEKDLLYRHKILIHSLLTKQLSSHLKEAHDKGALWASFQTLVAKVLILKPPCLRPGMRFTMSSRWFNKGGKTTFSFTHGKKA